MPIPTLAGRLRARPIDFGRWRDRPVTASRASMQGLRSDGYIATVPAPALDGDADAAMERLRQALVSLRIFPPGMVTLAADTPDGRAMAGATVVQRVFFGPFALESAVRLIEVRHDMLVDGAATILTWATVQGHPERGLETFTVEKDETGSVTISIRSLSAPATLLVRAAAPFGRWMQRRLSRAAMRHLRSIVRDE